MYLSSDWAKEVEKLEAEVEAAEARVAELAGVLREMLQAYLDQCAMQPDPALCNKARAVLAAVAADEQAKNTPGTGGEHDAA